MATLHGTVVAVHGITNPSGPVVDSAGAMIQCCYLHVNFTGTYAQANDADVLLVPAAIAGFMHDGRTITILQAAMAAPGDEAGTPIGIQAATVSSTTISFQLSDGALTAEHANAALGAFTRPIAIFVVYSSAA